MAWVLAKAKLLALIPFKTKFLPVRMRDVPGKGVTLRTLPLFDLFYKLLVIRYLIFETWKGCAIFSRVRAIW